MLYLSSQMRDINPSNRGIKHYNESFYRAWDPVSQMSNSCAPYYCPYDKIFFAPDTPAIRGFMNRSFLDTSLSAVGFDSEQAVVEKAKKTKSSESGLWGAVIFTDVSGDGLPPVLKYKLRPNGDIIDNIGSSYYDGNPVYRMTDYTYPARRYLLGIQMLIDINYIMLHQRQGSASGPKFYIQRMPCPALDDFSPSMTALFILPMMVISGYFIPCIIVVKRVLEEKNNRAKEMMKMMGMSTPAYWAGVFISNILVMLIIAVIVTIAYSIPFSSTGSVLQSVSSLLFFVILLLYCVSMLLLCCCISTLFTRAAIAITVLVVIWVVGNVCSSIYLQDLRAPYLGKVFSCLVPNVAFTIIGVIMSINEASGVGTQWSNISDPPYGSRDSFCLATVLGMMFCSCVIYGILLLYLDTVWPWQPGVPKSPLFCFYPSYWSFSKKTKSEEGSSIVKYEEKSDYFEEEPSHSPPSVVISAITKVFSTGNVDKIAVNDLSLNLYPGQITALLGHNGAGKTTTMNILTGIFPPTKGSVSISGHDVVTDTNAARSNLGLCPQHSVLYDTLTVEEHLKLFAGLKGMPWAAIKREIPKLLQILKLDDKTHTQAKSLSGGMKRKLSLGNAIIGDSQILILDEPTTGLDPEARRVIWDVLEQLRPERTILLTTHYMEEADTLGDRIAIMASGNVQCCGSAMFLKRKFGAGYRLRIEKGNKCDVDGTTSLVKSHVPEAELLSDVSLELMFSLPNTSKQFSALFEDLEENNGTLGIASCGITITTMDDVFLRVGQMTEEQYQSNKDQEPANNVSETMSMHNASKSRPTLFKQMEALLRKRVHYSRRHLSLLIFQIVLPVIAIILYLFLNFVPVVMPPDSMDVDLDELFKEKKVGFYQSVNIPNDPFSHYYKNTLEEEKVEVLEILAGDDPDTFLSKRGKKDTDSYLREYLVGGSRNESDTELSVIAWFNGMQYNLDLISINLMTTSLLRLETENMSQNIYAKIQPMVDEDTPRFAKGASDAAKLFNAVFIALGLTFLSSSFVLLPVHERTTKAKLLQRMCGVNAVVYWLTHLLWDYLIYICSSLLLLIPFIVYHGINGFVASEAIGAVFFCLLLFGLSSTVFSYVVSFIPKVPSTGFSILTTVNSITGVVVTVVMTTLVLIIPPTDKVKIAMWFMRFLPNFAVTWGINVIHMNSLHNIECLRYNKDALFEKCYGKVTTGINPCCTDDVKEGKGYQGLPYLAWEKGAGRECFCLFLTFLFWSGILILMETVLPRMCYTLIQMIKQRKVRQRGILSMTFASNEDSDVSAERGRTEDICYRRVMASEALVVRDLTKTFGVLNAVKKLTFSVQKEECFGLLGINGAGKTTTFRMLVGDLLPTAGDAYINNDSIQRTLSKFQMSLGYCPQFDALIDRLTAREILELFARLRGISEKEVSHSVNQMMSRCDLDDYADKQARSYSGGTKRKLSLAIALIGAPPVVLLDEPTAGVDPTARRKIWKTLSAMKEMLGVSFILTSHSMDECESLCNRIAIMVNGEFRCLGATQSLQAKFGQGFSLVIKLKQEDFLDINRVAEIRTYIEKQFPSASLKVEYQGNLHYHITDTSVKWSRMFAVMEEAKIRFQFEDYVLSGTTLEQIFLAFARAQTGLV